MRNDLLAVWNYFRAIAGVLAFVVVCGLAGMIEDEGASAAETSTGYGVSPVTATGWLNESEKRAASDLADYALSLASGIEDRDARVAAALAVINSYAAPCAAEDSPGPCYWDASTRGNGAGRSYFTHADASAERIYWRS